ncbi:type IA DNA topoisomerase [Clostridium sp. ZS2-4]|uniref:type IA DNA topoisomerase n=1 Tax=Clostridium sp. ZS2-4 TaxID=2987703 RepID=UPI00227A1DDF|nr:type IA DNA topoisomerase [Clostridium sp. ZS2-4]MCY6356789.1 DNA topoisomerase [Clostridium sp. ZS2-4]
MGKSLYVTEKPSVAMEFVKLLNVKGNKGDGFIEGQNEVFTWCVGHMVTMSYPEAYNEKLKKWSLDTIPFLPKEYKYEIISSVVKQFNAVKNLLLRDDIDIIYVCTDSGREGEYIYRLVDMMVGVKDKVKKRVWIDSQTEEEIKRGIKEAKLLSEYDALSDSAYLRAKEDYLLGINFSRLLTLIYGRTLSNILGEESVVIAVGRVMSCVLGMIVSREIEIRDFKQTSFYKISANFKIDDTTDYDGEWKAIEASKYFETNLLYNEGGFKKREDAESLIEKLSNTEECAVIQSISKKKENKNPPLLFNLAELQNECSKRFKITPDETLNKVQSLYEKKMLTYPRTDARVLSKAVGKEIHKNIKKLTYFKDMNEIKTIAEKILSKKSYENLEKTKYVDDSKITDHYAIIPTGEGLGNYNSLNKLEKDIYNLVVRRFLAIFYPAAKYSKIQIETKIGEESFFTTDKVCVESGYLVVLNQENNESENKKDMAFLNSLKKGQNVKINSMDIKEGKTSPPKRYTSGSIIIAMENAGKLIEDEELREQIKGSGIGTSATRAEILKKLERIDYIKTNRKTQVLTPSLKGEVIYRVIKDSIPSLLNPKLTASWEKGLSMVADRAITSEVFMGKLEMYVKNNAEKVVKHNNVINTEYLVSIVKEQKGIDIEESKINDVLGVCPICNNGRVVRNSKGYGCDNWKNGCKFFVGTICGVQVSVEQIKKLIKYGRTDMINGFKSKKGNIFSARLIIKDKKVEMSFQ